MSCDNSDGEPHFAWEPSTVNMIAKVDFPGTSDTSEKQLHVAGHIFEMCLQLCLSPDDDMSRNLGFEVLLGVFAGHAPTADPQV